MIENFAHLPVYIYFIFATVAGGVVGYACYHLVNKAVSQKKVKLKVRESRD